MPERCPKGMRFSPILLLCVACSISSTQEAAESVDGGMQTRALVGPESAVPQYVAGHFYSHDVSRPFERERLELDEFHVSIETSPGTIRTRIDAIIRNPSKAQRQARIRVPIPANAAVTEAVLFVGGKPMRGAFLEANRAEKVYKSYTERRRDPLLAVWDGPDGVDLQIFPVEGEKTRRFQLEWVEPRVFAGEAHQLPVLARGTTAIRAQGDVVVDGLVMEPRNGAVALHATSNSVISGRRPGGALGYVLAPGQRPSESAVVLVAETSARMTLERRAEQHESIEALLATLPSNTRVSLLSADWMTKPIVVDVTPAQARAALPRLDEIISAGYLDVGHTFAEASDLAKKIGAQSVVFFGEGQSGFRYGAFQTSTEALQREKVALFAVSSGAVSAGIRRMAAKTNGRVASVVDQELLVLLRGYGAPPEIAGVEGWAVLNAASSQPVWAGRFLGGSPSPSKVGATADLAALWARSQVHSRGYGSESSVLTPTTSILALESDAEYTRWGIPVPAAIEDDPSPRKRHIAMQSNAPKPQLARAQAIDTARAAGVLGVGTQTPGGQFASLSDGRDVYGGLLGNAMGQPSGEMAGGWGYGVSGVGPGGGGTGWGTIGTGTYGTIGHGMGRGTRASRSTPRVAMGKATVRGDLDTNIVRRYLRRKFARIRHCYEKELLVTPRLAGTVVVQFQISPQGLVQAAKALGMSNRNVETCVAAAIASIQFPKPKGGGYVNVRYPFAFSAENTAPSEVTEPLALALAAYKTLDKRTRARELSKRLGVDFASEAMLAWWILKENVQANSMPVEGVVLAATLLHAAGDTWNSRRVFSQVSRGLPSTMGEHLRSVGFTADQQRLTALRQ